MSIYGVYIPNFISISQNIDGWHPIPVNSKRKDMVTMLEPYIKAIPVNDNLLLKYYQHRHHVQRHCKWGPRGPWPPEYKFGGLRVMEFWVMDHPFHTINFISSNFDQRFLYRNAY